MRLPLAANLESRDGTTSRDALVTNALVEVRGDRAILRMRPRVVAVYTGGGAPAPQMLASWYGFHAVFGDQINSYPTFASATGLVQTTLTTEADSDRMSYAVTASGAATPRMMFKNRSNAWTMTKGYTVSAVTYGATMGAETFAVQEMTRSSTTVTVKVQGDTGLSVGSDVTIAGAVETQYNGTWAVTSVTAPALVPERVVPITITRSGTTATATTVSGDHGLTTATAYTIGGANQSGYNGSKTVTVTGTNTFTFTVTTAAMASPATGSPAIAEKAHAVGLDNAGYVDKTTFDVTSTSGDFVGVAAGSQIRIAGFLTGTYDGLYTVVSVINAQKVTITIPGFTGSAIDADCFAYAQFSAVSSLTYTATTATLTTSSAHNLQTGNSITVAGADQSGYNGTFTVTRINSTQVTYTLTPVDSPETPATGAITVTVPQSVGQSQFTFTIGTTPTTPATGTITAATEGGTVPGIAYLNGYFAVMDRNGIIYTSAQDDPTSWNALDFIIAQKEDGQGVALAKSRDYIVAFKEWSTELFYDAQNATGSPLGPVDTGFTRIGCANGWSVAEIDDAIIFVGQSRASGRGVWLRDGINAIKISTPDIDRILTEDALTTVYAFAFKPGGRTVYVLTLPASDLTLAYDLEAKMWGEWSRNDTAAISASVSSITRDGDWATVTTATAHFLNDGDPALVSGATQTEYNGKFVASVIDATSYRYKVSGAPTTPATGTITSWAYAGDSHMNYMNYVFHEGQDVVQNASDGNTIDIFSLEPDANSREAVPQFRMRTPAIDMVTTDLKKLPFVRLISTNGDGHAWIRWSDDDGLTWTKFRPVDLGREQAELRRCGSFRSRRFEVKYIGTRPPLIEALEMDPR